MYYNLLFKDNEIDARRKAKLAEDTSSIEVNLEDSNKRRYALFFSYFMYNVLCV